jgi:Predicted phosphotransferase related to Ser/Thr protein kinases
MKLSPAQSNFLAKNIPGYDSSQWTVTSAGAAGSDRRFLRIQKKSGDADTSYVLILWDSRDEDWGRFLTIEKELGKTILFLPKIYASDGKHGLILEEDLGNTTLKKYCEKFPDKIEDAYHSALDALIAWQKTEITANTVIASRSMDLEVFLWESKYFSTHCVTEFFGCDNLLDKEWETERMQIALFASNLPKVCIHRDFQSENILIDKGSIRFVDFQGARLGPAGYDLASLLFDPYVAELDDSFTLRLFDYYCSKASVPISHEAFYVCSLQRLMQACGAYGNLSIHKGKEQYRKFIPLAIDRSIRIVEKLPGYPQLCRIVKKCRESLKEETE